MTDTGAILNAFYAAVIKRDLAAARKCLDKDLVLCWDLRDLP